MVSQWFHYNPLSLQCRDIFLCNMCCRYGMLNGIIDSQKVRAQKATAVAQSSGSSFIPHHSKGRLEIEILKESLRQKGEKMRRWDEAMRQQDEFYA
jgi:hypothetical protein